MKILIAEDSEFSRIILEELFTETGYDITFVENGKDAVESIKNNHFDIVFMDIEMPIMNGHDAAIIIRNELNISRKELPIIAMTGHKDENYLTLLINTVFNSSVSKDFNKTELFESINKYVNNNNESNIDISEGSGQSYNLQYLNELTNSDQDFNIEILKSFLDSSEKFYNNINLAISNTDFENICFYSHKFSSQVSFIGNNDAVKMIDEIEELSSKKENIEKIIDLVKQSKKIIDSVIINIKSDFNL